MTANEAKKLSEKIGNQAAYDEAKRELDVRERCYGKWVKEGKLARTDADARFSAQAKVVALLADFPGVTSNGTQDSSEWKPF